MPDIAAKRIRVVIADDQPVLREALEELLASDPELELVGSAADAAEAVEMAVRLLPDVAVLDVRMPGGGGVAAARAIAASAPGVRILAFSAHGDRETVFEMLRAGARGYLVKGAPREEVIAGIKESARDRSVLSSEVASNVVSAFSDQLRENAEHQARAKERQQRIVRAIQGDALHMVYQPLVNLETGKVSGYEALARFTLGDGGPSEWFAEADEVGMLEELELRAIELAIDGMRGHDAFLSLCLNASPQTLGSLRLPPLLAMADRPVILEVTEHAPVVDYMRMVETLGGLRQRAVRLAVDDVGAGYSSLRHILKLRPEVIKLDISLTRGIDSDNALQAVAAAFIAFANRMEIMVVAEGIETAGELQTLTQLGAHMGQGFLLGRPGPLAKEQAA